VKGDPILNSTDLASTLESQSGAGGRSWRREFFPDFFPKIPPAASVIPLGTVKFRSANRIFFWHPVAGFL
jgi:hypothetical protein